MDENISGALESLSRDPKLGPLARYLIDHPENLGLLPGMADMVLRVSRLTAENQELREKTDRDHLTGLLNFRRYQEDLEREVARAGRSHLPVSLILDDLDHFKAINDTYGHPVGDEVLRRVSSIKSKHFRLTDFSYRIGGEEGAIILPGAGLDTAAKVADRIRGSVENLDISSRIKNDLDVYAKKRRDSTDELVYRRLESLYAILSGKPELRLTISQGMGDFPSPLIANAAGLASAVDKALYHSKSNGRNRATSVYDIMHMLR